MVRILIADDEMIEREVLCKTLRKNLKDKCIIFQAENGREALEAYEEYKIQIAILDIEMPGINGIELCRRILDKDIKVVFISSYQNYEYFRYAIQFRVEDYLLKPIDGGKLLQRVRQIIVEKLHGTLPEEIGEESDPILKRPYQELSPLIRKIVMIVGMEYGQHISLKSIADRFRMNPTYLGQIFIKETNMKFSEYLMAYRMYAARSRIMETDSKIAEVANEVGYTNMNYFHQHFHQYYGISPLRMRMGESGEDMDQKKDPEQKDN